MRMSPPRPARWTRSVLHAVFALTGVTHAMIGPLLPSLTRAFHLADSESGLLLFVYFAGSSLGALLCRGNYVRVMTGGFAGMTLFGLAISLASRSLLLPLYLLLGICVGAAMSSVSLFAGRNFPTTSASLLTLLNFTWSAGALSAPLLASQILRYSSYRTAYAGIAVLSFIAAMACGWMLTDATETAQEAISAARFGNAEVVVLFAVLAFLQVGMENTASVWLTTYVLRISGTGVVTAAASSSLFWLGFLGSRAFSAAILLRTRMDHVLRAAILLALGASLLLIASWRLAITSVAMVLLGVALAPIYPLVVAASMARLRRTSDARYVLAAAGVGGSILPWMTGWVSTSAGSLRAGLLVVPVSLVLMLLGLRAVHGAQAKMPLVPHEL